MLQLTNFTNAPNQIAEISLPDGTTANFSLTFDELVNSWFFDFSYSNKNLNYFGQRLTSNPNLLYPFRNILTFGLMCTVNDGGEAWFINDFITGRVNLYILDATDLQIINSFLNNA